MESAVLIGLTMGDPAGIGPEIIVKALSLRELWSEARLVVIGNRKVLTDALNIVGSEQILTEITDPAAAKGYGYINYIECGLPKEPVAYGQVSRDAGQAAYMYVTKAIQLALEGRIAAVVTAPLNKEALARAGCPYPGHTEIFAALTGTKDYAMMLAAGRLRVVHVSTHVGLRKACELVTREQVLKTILITARGLADLGIEAPRIGVAGLNPHAGEGGLFGDEEITAILPAIEEARKQGLNVEGPVPPDTVFVKCQGGQYDAVVAMYHDQGHIPVKMAGFSMDPASGTWSSVQGVNITLGLPIIRTSVDHGVAFGKAGKGTANPESMVEAIRIATRMARIKARKMKAQ